MKVYVLIDVDYLAREEGVEGVYASVAAAKSAYHKYEPNEIGEWHSPDPSLWRFRLHVPRKAEAARIEEHEVQE